MNLKEHFKAQLIKLVAEENNPEYPRVSWDDAIRSGLGGEQAKLRLKGLFKKNMPPAEYEYRLRNLHDTIRDSEVSADNPHRKTILGMANTANSVLRKSRIQKESVINSIKKILSEADASSPTSPSGDPERQIIISNPQGNPFNNPFNVNPWDPAYQGPSPYAPGEPFFHDGHWWFHDGEFWWFQDSVGGHWWYWDGGRWIQSNYDENNPHLDSTTGTGGSGQQENYQDPNNWKPAFKRFFDRLGTGYTFDGYTPEGWLIVRAPNGGIQIYKPNWREGYPNWQDFPEHMWPEIRPRWDFDSIPNHEDSYNPYNDPGHPDYIDPDQYGGWQDENGQWHYNNPENAPSMDNSPTGIISRDNWLRTRRK